MKKFIEELKRRNVIKSALAYLVVAWVLLQALQMLLPMVNAPVWTLKGITIIMAIGLPVWIIVSWIYDITPQGIEKTAKDSGSELVTQVTNKRLNLFIIVSLSIAVIVMGLKLTNIFEDSNKEYSIAVLPFDNKSSDGDTQWFCDGISGSILTNLSKISSLTIISETSSKRYKETYKTIPEIAKELGVSYILEGDVTIYKDQIKINAQLISSQDKHIWAEDYHATFENVLDLQGSIAKQIALQLKIKLTPVEKEILNTSSTTNIEAYKSYLNGLAINNSFTIGNDQLEIAAYNESIIFFKDAISIDSNYADAYAEIANSYRNLAFYSSDGEDYLQLSKDFTAQALAINPNTPQAYINMALINKHVDRDHVNFEINIKKALELDPNNAKAHMEYAFHYEHEEYYDGEKMLSHINKANLIDPLSNAIKSIKVDALIFNSKFDEAEVFLDKSSNIYEPHILVDKKGLIYALRHKDQTLRFTFLTEALEKYPENAGMYQSLSWYYKTIFKDKINFLKYAKMAYELGATSDNAKNYLYALYVNEQFETAKQILNSEIFDKRSNIVKTRMIFDYYTYQGDYDNAIVYLEKLKPLNIFRYYLEKAWMNSKMGNDEIVNDVFTKSRMTPVTKSICFAYLKQRDSMYFYLNMISNTKNPNLRYNRAMTVNSDISFHPYLNEPRFQDFLKKHYLPILN